MAFVHTHTHRYIDTQTHFDMQNAYASAYAYVLEQVFCVVLKTTGDTINEQKKNDSIFESHVVNVSVNNITSKIDRLLILA